MIIEALTPDFVRNFWEFIKEGNYEKREKSTESLICLKAKAFLDMQARKEKGEPVDERHIRKHKTDVFRLALFLTPDSVFNLPAEIKTDMQQFIEKVENDLPDPAIFKEMGAGNIDEKALFNQLAKNFDLKASKISGTLFSFKS